MEGACRIGLHRASPPKIPAGKTANKYSGTVSQAQEDAVPATEVRLNTQLPLAVSPNMNKRILGKISSLRFGMCEIHTVLRRTWIQPAGEHMNKFLIICRLIRGLGSSEAKRLHRKECQHLIVAKLRGQQKRKQHSQDQYMPQVVSCDVPRH